jgi:protein-S-isoprenylcysteine O-methyltransferase Ste14
MKRYQRARTNEERRRRTVAALPGAIAATVGILLFVFGARLLTGHDPPQWTAYPVVALVVGIGLFVEWREGTRGQ